MQLPLDRLVSMGSTISFLICYLFPHFITAGQISNQFVHQAQNWILSSTKYMSVKIWFSPLLVRIIEFICTRYSKYLCYTYNTFYLHLIYIWFSPRLCTEHGSVMFELMARWNVWGLVKILISESSPPLVQTEKRKEDFFHIGLFFVTPDYPLYLVTK